MSRRKNADKGKESLELLGVKIDPALKKSIEDEGNALGVPMSTYARQLLITGWRSRHEAAIAKNPRESILLGWFNDLPIAEQENVLAMVEALHKKHVTGTPAPDGIPDKPYIPRNPPAPITFNKKGGRKS